MTDNLDKELILAEYTKLQDIVEEFDARALTIKAWSVSLSAAGIVTSYIEASTIILFVASASALAFWLVEGLWKVNQQCFYPRIRAIETALEQGSSIPALQIAGSWSKAWRERRNAGFLVKVLCWPHVALPHVIVAVLGMVLLVLLPPQG